MSADPRKLDPKGKEKEENKIGVVVPTQKIILLLDVDDVLLMEGYNDLLIAQIRLFIETKAKEGIEVETYLFTNMSVNDADHGLDKDGKISRQDLTARLAQDNIVPKAVVTPADFGYGHGMGAAYQDFVAPHYAEKEVSALKIQHEQMFECYSSMAIGKITPNWTKDPSVIHGGPAGGVFRPTFFCDTEGLRCRASIPTINEQIHDHRDAYLPYQQLAESLSSLLMEKVAVNREDSDIISFLTMIPTLAGTTIPPAFRNALKPIISTNLNKKILLSEVQHNAAICSEIVKFMGEANLSTKLGYESIQDSATLIKALQNSPEDNFKGVFLKLKQYDILRKTIIDLVGPAILREHFGLQGNRFDCLAQLSTKSYEELNGILSTFISNPIINKENCTNIMDYVGAAAYEVLWNLLENSLLNSLGNPQDLSCLPLGKALTAEEEAAIEHKFNELNCQGDVERAYVKAIMAKLIKAYVAQQLRAGVESLGIVYVDDMLQYIAGVSAIFEMGESQAKKEAVSEKEAPSEAIDQSFRFTPVHFRKKDAQEADFIWRQELLSRIEAAIPEIKGRLFMQAHSPFLPNQFQGTEDERAQLLKEPFAATSSDVFILEKGFVALCAEGDPEALFKLAQLCVEPYMHNPQFADSFSQDKSSAYYFAQLAILQSNNVKFKHKVGNFLAEYQLQQYAEVHCPHENCQKINLHSPDELYAVKLRMMALNVQAAAGNVDALFELAQFAILDRRQAYALAKLAYVLCADEEYRAKIMGFILINDLHNPIQDYPVDTKNGFKLGEFKPTDLYHSIQLPEYESKVSAAVQSIRGAIPLEDIKYRYRALANSEQSYNLGLQAVKDEIYTQLSTYTPIPLTEKNIIHNKGSIRSKLMGTACNFFTNSMNEKVKQGAAAEDAHRLAAKVRNASSYQEISNLLDKEINDVLFDPNRVRNLSYVRGLQASKVLLQQHIGAIAKHHSSPVVDVSSSLYSPSGP